MNQEHILQYIKQPHRIDSSATQEIEQILNQYPYFQTAHLLHIKGLKNNSSIHFNEQLKRAAIYAGNRSVLFSLLNNEDAVEYAPELSSTDSFDNNKPEIEKDVSENKEQSKPQTTEETIDEQTEKIIETKHTPETEKEIESNVTKEETLNEQPHETQEELIEANKTEKSPSVTEDKDSTTSNETQIETEALISKDIQASENKEEEKEKHTTTSEKSPEHTEQSLADIILQRLKEIEERDSIDTETATSTPTDDTHAHHKETTDSAKPPLISDTEHTDDLLELSETETNFTEANTENTSSNSQEKTSEKDEKLSEDILSFDFSLETEQEDTHTTKPEKEKKPITKKKKTPVHASTMWFENEQISEDELDISNPIDAFIAKQPNFKPRLNPEQEEKEQPHDISENSVQEGEYLSETLAKIYISQKNYTKALEIYEKLSLKYPQKSVYFANQISEIKQKLK